MGEVDECDAVLAPLGELSCGHTRSPALIYLRGHMRSFLLIVAAGLMMLLIAVGSNMARSARANAHTSVIATQR